MAIDAGAQSARGNRPRPLLLIVLGIVVVAFVMMKLGGAAGPRPPAPANASRAAAQAALAESTPAVGRGRGSLVDPRSLDVHLEALASQKPVNATTERNPFRFRPAPAPPPPAKMAPGPPVGAPPVNAGPPPPPPPPPITVKFIGLIERADGTKLAVFTDCTAGRRQSQAKEGGVVDGRYRLVKIGLQSVIIEHLDGRGRTTLAQGGQECVK